MYKVGITGGIGSGKSYVCDMLRERGVAIYNSDIRAKQLMNSSSAIREALVANFGDECYTSEGLNREFLASVVFSDSERLNALNGIVHPAVIADFNSWAEEQEGSYVVLESAILFEAGLEGSVDVVVAVMAPESLRIERVMARDGATREQVAQRIANQLSDEERSSRAKYAVVNIDVDDLAEDVEQLHRRLSYDSQNRRD
ncbi:MAG: dephospho-CoA kinase [Alistipes sp.]|nr:dephospho-CoA kinase [Alistipes sp.]